jgi:predicted nucleotidyltransferase
MLEKISRRISEIENEEQVKIFYACESGSRAWGFPSADSDYDVRFLYLHPRDWYLSVDLERRPDVIEHPIDGMLDASGWDLRKALRLLRKSNPPLVEWLGSPTIYREQFSVADQLRQLAASNYSPIASLYHYLRMAQGNYRDYLKGPVVWIKKYFYVLRPLLAILWLERDLGLAPTEFAKLLGKTVDSPELRSAIEKLLEATQRGVELDRGPRIGAISDFIERELTRLEGIQFGDDYIRPVGSIDDFNRLFRAALDEVWSPAGMKP